MWDRKNIKVKGIVAGIAFDFLSSIIASIVVGMAFMYLSGITNEMEFQKELEQSFIIRIVFLCIGLVTVFFMGFISEWVAKSSTVINATICGLILFIFEAVTIYFMPDAAPLWLQATILIGVLPLSITGGYIYGKVSKT